MTTQRENLPVAIIGYGTAGVNVAIGLRTAGYTGPIVAFSDTDIRPYSPILTSYYAAGMKSYDECFPFDQAQLDELNVDVRTNTPVTKLDPATHTICTANGEFTYEKCVITTGATPRCWGFPADCGYDPLVLRTMDDAQRLKDALENPACKRVLVSGSSMVALKILEACLEQGKQTALVGMMPHVLDRNAMPVTAERFERGLEAQGVQLRLGMVIKEVAVVPANAAAPQGRRLRVTFSNGDVDEFDEIAVAHGMGSNVEFVAPGALEGRGAFIVDEFMRTTNPDVYAAGDVAQGTEFISGTKQVVGIWKNAAVQGACAGAAIAAELAGEKPQFKNAFKGSIATNTIAVRGVLFISAGTIDITENRSVEVRETEDTTVAYVFQTDDAGEKRLVGFNLTCDNDIAGSVAYDTGAMLTLRIERSLGL